METSSEGNLLEIIDLAHSLRQEHLYIINEQHMFMTLNDTLNKNSTNVAQLAWICAQQRENLNSLIVSRPDTGPSICCHKANLLENTKFIDAHKAKGIKYQHVLSYIELFNFLHRSPYLLAQSLAIGDRVCRLTPDHMNSVVHTIASGLYGNAILSKDIDMMLRLLRELIELQIVVSDNPRRMLRSGSCAFSRLYHRLHESLFSAKLFLTSALHEPIMKVLIEDEVMLDIDPIKAVSSFPQKERLKRFGVEGTAEYDDKIKIYRHETINRLYYLSNLFIQSLLDNWALFPSTLRWVVQTMCHLLKTGLINERETNDILTDMVFTNFICPAVVSPDLFGISDAPISENARFNLIQIGQILQMLALIKHEDIDAKFLELFDMFDRNIVSELMEQLLETEYDVSVSMMAIPHQNDFGRNHVLVTQSELNVFVDFLRSVLENDGLIISGEDRRKLGKILDQLPDKWETVLNGGDPIVPVVVADATHNSRAKQSLINLGKSTKNKLAKTMSLNQAAHTDASDADGNSMSYVNGHNGHHHINNNSNNINNNTIGLDEFEQVLIIPIAINAESKFQLLTEQEVLNMNNISKDMETISKDIGDADDDDDEDDDDDDDELNKAVNPVYHEAGAASRTRKHARFSLSNDDQSIGNASENLEAVSEVPSNHSVTSSLEMEEHDQNLNDNLSDMVSANVSGRGSPNISGRDTPSSQVTDGENVPIPSLQMAKMLSKARSDIDDKFCKFEINKLVEVDETVSIISDTWSTDVLASDSETIDASDGERNFSTPLIPSAVVLPGDNNFGAQMRASFLDASETRSESAWSTDVLASDSEKITELDTDDNNSIAANSDVTDAGRFDGELVRDADILPSSANRSPDSPFFAPRTQNAQFRTPDSLLMYSPLSSESVFTSNRAFEGSGAAGPAAGPRLPSEEFARFLSPITTYGRTSSTRDSPRYSENNGAAFRSQPFPRDTFIVDSSSRMRRQNSAESSISNQSSNYEEMAVGSTAAGTSSVAAQSHHHRNHRNPSASASHVTTAKIDYSFPDFGSASNAVDTSMAATTAATIVKSSTDIINPFADVVDNLFSDIVFKPITSKQENSTDVTVEQRHTSVEQRNNSFDGRRNGMSAFAMSPPITARQAASLNYENHEIILKSKSASMHIMPGVPAAAATAESSLATITARTDDDKTDQKDDFLLIQKTLSLSLGAVTGSINDTAGARGNIDFIDPMAGPSKPLRYTGAIPKSISFDESADKRGGDRFMRRSDVSNGAVPRPTNGNSFFNKLKQGFRNRRSHKPRNGGPNDFTPVGHPRNLLALDGVNGTESADSFRPTDAISFSDTSEDILAKYRRKISSSSDATNSDSIGNNRKNSQTDIDPRTEDGILLDEVPFMLNNAKRKLRLVLSTTDLHTADFRHTSCHKTPPLLTYLQIQLAQALNLQNLQQISFISETIRCLRLLDAVQQRQLILDLQQDLIKRQTYLQYLMRYRQHLLSALENIDRFEDRLRNDRDMCNRHLIMVCVRMFLEKRNNVIEEFQDEFGYLTVVDEKIDFLNEFMGKLMDELLTHDGILQGMAEWQLLEARICIERILLQRLYRQVMFPNDDGDISRDAVLREHIRKLSRLISPAHHALRIPQEYLIEAPWPFAQQQIAYISAYKTPREKVQCVVRCITSIMNLLQMASSRVPAADDLVPVLIYVVIKANPPYLLSTIQYVNAFIGDTLEGEDHYWWTQFSSAVTFIKTMDYNNE